MIKAIKVLMICVVLLFCLLWAIPVLLLFCLTTVPYRMFRHLADKFSDVVKEVGL